MSCGKDGRPADRAPPRRSICYITEPDGTRSHVFIAIGDHTPVPCSLTPHPNSPHSSLEAATPANSLTPEPSSPADTSGSASVFGDLASLPDDTDVIWTDESS
jgi:hypothetical protein